MGNLNDAEKRVLNWLNQEDQVAQEGDNGTVLWKASSIDPGDVAYGTVKRVWSKDSGYGETQYVELVPSNGRGYVLPLSSAVLKDKLSAVTVGKVVAVKYLGKRLSKGGRRYNDYRITLDGEEV